MFLTIWRSFFEHSLWVVYLNLAHQLGLGKDWCESLYLAICGSLLCLQILWITTLTTLHDGSVPRPIQIIWRVLVYASYTWLAIRITIFAWDLLVGRIYVLQVPDLLIDRLPLRETDPYIFEDSLTDPNHDGNQTAWY